MNNPFRYGRIATGEDFVGREKELDKVSRAMALGSGTAICAPQGMGKSSLLAELARRRSDEYLFVRVSFHGVGNEATLFNSFISQLAVQAFGRVESFGPAAWELLENPRHRRAVLEGDGQSEKKFRRPTFPSVMDLDDVDQGATSDSKGSHGIRMCSTCGRPLKWVEKYGRYYCYSCKKYTPIKRRVKPLTVDTLMEDYMKCPKCSRRLRYVHWYSELYCDRCRKYPFIEMGARRSPKPTILDFAEAFELPEKVADQMGKGVVIMFDEFQEVDTLDNLHLLETMGESFYNQKSVHYLFAGSDKHCFRQLFEEKDSPLNDVAEVMPLGPVSKEEVEKFLIRKFHDAHGRLALESAAFIAEVSGGRPYHFQKIAHESYHIASSPTINDVTNAVRSVVRHQSHAYATLWDSVKSPLQRRYLLAAATEPGVQKGEEFVRRHNLRSRSHVQRIEKQLETRGLIENGEICDPMLILWLRSSGAR